MDNNFHVLALSGGGYRGLYTARVLEILEESLGQPLWKAFDLICGTSVGGILALGLSIGIPAAQLRELFEQRGDEIFPNWQWWKALRGFVIARSSNDSLKRLLAEDDLFGGKTIGQLNRPIVIPAVNYSTGQPKTFKTPHHRDFERDWKLTALDVALATSAAPYYLPLHRIDRVGTFIDGGLFANNPSLIGLHEALHVFGKTNDQVRILNVGTMSKKLTGGGSERLSRGIAGWRTKLFSLGLSYQEGFTYNILKHQMGERFSVIDSDLTEDNASSVGLDTVTKKAINVLNESATQNAQEFLGKPQWADFKNHEAPPSTFYHGPKAGSTA